MTPPPRQSKKQRVPGSDHFDSVFDREVARLLRLRFSWLMGLWLALLAGRFLFNLSVMFAVGELGESAGLGALFDDPVALTLDLLHVGTLITAFVLVRTTVRQPAEVLRLAFWVYVLIGMWTLTGAAGSRLDAPFAAWNSNVSAGSILEVGWSIVPIALAHFGACLLLPWTPRQGLRPLFVLYPLWIVFIIVYERITPFHVAFGVLLAGSISSAGILFCWWRHSQLRKDVELRELRRHFSSTNRALIDAQKIHEQRFPNPLSTKRTRFTYVYEPMRQVGGDFLHVHSDAQGTITLVLFDVTGHGIAAALTVNRVDGEMKRLFAENPSRDLEDTAYALNRYFHLVMAPHSIFATAVFVKIHDDGLVEWVNAGHPPPVLRRATGEVEMLDTTTFMLGAVPSSVFKPEQRTTQLNDHDNLVIYTDGATEAADERGRQFGVNGIVRAVESWRVDQGTSLVSFIPQVVAQYRSGTTKDDILIASLARS